jgi:hypothetical protein
VVQIAVRNAVREGKVSGCSAVGPRHVITNERVRT